ncbi:hypothetical protein BT69DRAFT_289705 [Atractiella rhizophila]|nr:hypothetical protein BT69DRAFT_289705 [Atractiella rhizophila]
MISTLAQGNGTDNTIPNQGNDGDKRGPNTSLAMIILYAITGCVTFMFIIVIMSGAIRAIRHPDRYGPRAADAAGGRGGQTVARGLTRAILDTFPVVKFGRTSEDGGARRDGESSIEEAGEEAKKSVTTVELADLKKADGVNGEMTDGTKKGEGKSERASESTEPELTAADAHHLDVQHLSSEPEIEVASTATDAATSEDSKGKRRSMSPPPTTAAATTTAPATDDPTQIDSEHTCPICVDSFNDGDDIRILPCDQRHRFHRDCIDPWLLNMSPLCPLCRLDLSRRRGEGEEEEVVEDHEHNEDVRPPWLDADAIPPPHPSWEPPSPAERAVRSVGRFVRRKIQERSASSASDTPVVGGVVSAHEAAGEPSTSSAMHGDAAQGFTPSRFARYISAMRVRRGQGQGRRNANPSTISGNGVAASSIPEETANTDEAGEGEARRS